MNTLVELIPELRKLGRREAVSYSNGYRTRRWTYRDLYRHIVGVAARFDAEGLDKGDRILLWGENRPEWLAVFWAALARGIAVVPIDVHSSATFATRVQGDVGAKLLVHGARVDPPPGLLPVLSLESVSTLASDATLTLTPVGVDDVVQVLYTSGTTGEPKGVVHRHRNLVANLGPIKKEIDKHAWLARPFQPIRILGLLPTSHVFGQFTAVFIPVVLRGASVFIDEMHPGAVVEILRRERVSVLATVPRFLSQLREELTSRHPVDLSAEGKPGVTGAMGRWWRYRRIHSRLGWKFWAVLSGGARLSPADEAFFWHIGVALIQGYGLTETSSVVATNHPFHPKRGALGQAVGNQRIQLAEDGEILVRGDNVSLEIFGKSSPSAEDPWLRTGDIGEIGEDGTLYFRGRKKDVIVGADGLNVHPSDIEAVLNRQPEIQEAVVVGRRIETGDQVHAVLLAAAPDDRHDNVELAVSRANRELEPHQRIKEWSLWPESDFPRTASTMKIRRHEVQERLHAPESRPSSVRDARGLLADQLGKARDALGEHDRLAEELGLSSLDRIELLTTLERELGRELSETGISAVETVDQLEAFVRAPSESEPRERSALDGIVRHSRKLLFRAVRTIFREAVIRPLFRHYLPLTVDGGFTDIEGPVIFAANHQSNLDTLALLTTLPWKLRERMAPAIHQGYFDPYLERRGTLRQRASFGLQFWLAVILTGAFPLPRGGASSRRSLRFAGSLVERSHSILIFPEGRLTRDGAMGVFKPGVGILAVKLQIPVVPIHIDGLYEVMSFRDRWPRPGPVRLNVGEALRFRESDRPAEVSRRIEAAVRELGPARK